jgi:hypothetical protein
MRITSTIKVEHRNAAPQAALTATDREEAILVPGLSCCSAAIKR